MDIHELAKKHEEYLLTLRRTFHQNPELSHQEHGTAARIRAELDGMGLPWEAVEETGTVAWLDTGRPGRSLAIRADIDALPMQEEVDWEYRSLVPGVMHACGHDVHTATLLTAAKCLCELRDELCGVVYFCFENAEEIAGGGAKSMVAWLRDRGGVDQVIGNHMEGSLAPGCAWVRSGTANAGNCHWRVVIRGRGGHGSRPDAAVDPIRIACRVLDRLTQIPSNHHDPFDPLVVSPCMIHGGTAYNIIPDECVIEGNLRFFSPAALEEVLAQMERVSRGIAESEGASAELHNVSSCPPVVNDPAVAERCRRIMEQVGLRVVESDGPGMASDDFALFPAAFPGCYVNIGARSDRPGTSHVIHNTRLFLEESAFLPIAEFFTAFAADLLGAE